MKIQTGGGRLLFSSIMVIVFNLGLLVVFGLLDWDTVSFIKWDTGRVFLLVGAVIGTVSAFWSYKSVIDEGYGRKLYWLLASNNRSALFTLITMVILVGPAEDLFFLGFLQNTLTPSLGAWSVVCYAAIFTLIHYGNVKYGAETTGQFKAVLPARFLISIVLSLSVYLTGSLLYSFIVHNLVDTLNFAALILAMKKRLKGLHRAS